MNKFINGRKLYEPGSEPYPASVWPVGFLSLLILVLPVLLGAWAINVGKGIITKYVSRVRDGQTTKSEILACRRPPEVKRTPEGLVFVYRGFDTAGESVRWKDRNKDGESEPPSFVDSPYSLDETLNWRARKAPS